jgi:hypothetical protein
MHRRRRPEQLAIEGRAVGDQMNVSALFFDDTRPPALTATAMRVHDTGAARHPQPGEVGVVDCRDWYPFTGGKLLKGAV